MKGVDPAIRTIYEMSAKCMKKPSLQAIAEIVRAFSLSARIAGSGLG